MPRPRPALPPAPPLVGRGDALAALLARLRARDGRLVTVTGPPGVGKSALAAAAAAEIAREGREITWLDLADVDRPELARGALARALGAGDDAGPDALAAALGGGRPGAAAPVLVLDGADAVIDALAGDLVALARHAAGRATALVTSSRRPATTADATLVLGGLSPEDGAALFLRAAGGGDERAARDVVTALDGHPLALLLAGAQASALGVAALVARLPSLLDAAEAPLVDVHARHRSLRAALGLSWEALSPAEQRALAALATFAGAFDAAAAEAVIASPDALDLLARLVRASWIGATEGGDARRLRIPAFARHFAAEAAPGAHAAAVPRYRRWVAAAAEAAWRGAAEGDVLRWCDAVAALEHDLWSVLRAGRDAAHAPHVALALGLVLDERGAALERDAADLALASGAPDELTARLLVMRAHAHAGLGELEAAVADLDRAVALADAAARPLALAQRALVAARRGDGAAALADAGRATAAISEAVPPRAALYAEATAAILAFEGGDVARAEPWLERLHGRARALDDVGAAAELSGILGNLAHCAGRLAPARQRLEDAAQGAAALGRARLEAIFRGYVGLVDHEAGRGDDALGAYAAAIDGTSRTGSHRHEALFRAARAALLATLDRDAALAREDLARALDAAGGLGPRPLALAVAAFREVARARWDDAGTAGLPALPEGATVDDDVVIARRIAGAALAGLAPAPVLVVSADCADVRLAAPIELSRRAPLRRVLGALVDAHARDRGAYVPPEALQAAGWPGERMLADAGRQRVRVAIWTLRKLGLQDVVESEAGAYRLSPRVVVERARPRV